MLAVDYIAENMPKSGYGPSLTVTEDYALIIVVCQMCSTQRQTFAVSMHVAYVMSEWGGARRMPYTSFPATQATVIPRTERTLYQGQISAVAKNLSTTQQRGISRYACYQVLQTLQCWSKLADTESLMYMPMLMSPTSRAGGYYGRRGAPQGHGGGAIRWLRPSGDKVAGKSPIKPSSCGPSYSFANITCKYPDSKSMH